MFLRFLLCGPLNHQRQGECGGRPGGIYFEPWGWRKHNMSLYLQASQCLASSWDSKANQKTFFLFWLLQILSLACDCALLLLREGRGSKVTQGQYLSCLPREIAIASGSFGLVQDRIRTFFQVTHFFLKLECLRLSAPLKGRQGLRATNAHFFWPWQAKKILWFCHLTTLSVASSSVSKEFHIFRPSPHRCWWGGEHGGESLYSKVCLKLCWDLTVIDGLHFTFQLQRIPTLLGSNNGTPRFLNS